MNKHKNDVSQIKKYLQGGLDSRAMHELERRALDDPFLADAFEGYGSAKNDQQQNLTDLSARLENRVDNKVKRPIPWSQLSIAASILIMIGVGIWLVTSNKPQKQNLKAAIVKADKKNVQPTISTPSPVASQKSNTDTNLSKRKYAANPQVALATPSAGKAAPKPEVGAAAIKSDTLKLASVSPVQASVPAKAIVANADQAQFKSEDKKPLNEVIVQNMNANKQSGYPNIQSAKKAPQASAETLLQAHVEGLEVKPSHNTNNNTLTGYVLGANGGQPLVGAIVKLAGANFGVVTDANGKFVMHDVPEKKSLVVGSIGYNTKQVKVNGGDSINVSLEPLNTTLNEVTISTDDKNKSLTNAHPSAGWKALTDYLDKNAISPDGQTGTVRILFMVDGKGGLSDFKVITSLSDAADKKAINLLTNGPAWAGNIDGQPHEVTVTLKFH